MFGCAVKIAHRQMSFQNRTSIIEQVLKEGMLGLRLRNATKTSNNNNELIQVSTGRAIDKNGGNFKMMINMNVLVIK